MAENKVIDVDSLEISQAKTIFENLSEIFSDADPTYLEEISHNYSLNSYNLNNFIMDLINSKNYPKRKKVEAPAIVQPPRSCHRDSVEMFVEKFNDPFGYFKQRNVGEVFFGYSKKYLSHKFKFTGLKVISSILVENKFNLTLSKLILEDLQPDRKSKRNKCELLPYEDCPNEDFLDEVFFLENEEKIKEHLAFLKLKLDVAKANNELLECQCCFNDEVFGTDVITCVEGHIFCKECVKRSIEIAFGDGKTRFYCLSDCDSEFLVENLQNLLPTSLHNKIMARLQESEIKAADITGICFCPYCEYAEIPCEDDKVFKCKSCFKESCRFCQDENHIPLSCEEFANDKKKTSARKNIEDKMTEALLRVCYKCKLKFIKQDGCNKMTCSCGAIMCYLCRQPVKDYSHFDPRQHGELQVASTSKGVKKCPLWTNNNAIHNRVVAAARSATAEMVREHPEFHFDERQLLKGLKRKINE